MRRMRHIRRLGPGALALALVGSACDRGADGAEGFDATARASSPADTGWVNLEGVEFPR